jgi:hypothetical protein
VIRFCLCFKTSNSSSQDFAVEKGFGLGRIMKEKGTGVNLEI